VLLVIRPYAVARRRPSAGSVLVCAVLVRVCNLNYMITNSERVRGWFAGRLPEEWQSEPARVTVDREEITVVLTIPDVRSADASAGEEELDEARAGRARAFREDTREQRMEIDREAQRRYERKVSWGVSVGGREELWTNVASPVMTRLRQPQRQVLDTLVASGVARSRSEALAWCVRLVGQHEEDWLTELRDAMTQVADVRSKGPAA
jgi:Arc/MetJ-type ribon-helix-helix transcriptional regulator